MIVVADTSVIINLALVGQEELLRLLFHEVLVPPAVQTEFTRLASTGGRFQALRLPDWIQVREPVAIPPAVASQDVLDAGERQALALALEMHADAVLIDEAAARAIAIDLGLIPIGVLGILVRAKRHGNLPAVRPVIDALLVRARFRVADAVVREALRLADELI